MAVDVRANWHAVSALDGALNGKVWWLAKWRLSRTEGLMLPFLAMGKARRFLLNARVIALVEVDHIRPVECLFENAGCEDEAVVQFRSPTKQIIALR